MRLCNISNRTSTKSKLSLHPNFNWCLKHYILLFSKILWRKFAESLNSIIYHWHTQFNYLSNNQKKQKLNIENHTTYVLLYMLLYWQENVQEKNNSFLILSSFMILHVKKFSSLLEKLWVRFYPLNSWENII